MSAFTARLENVLLLTVVNLQLCLMYKLNFVIRKYVYEKYRVCVHVGVG